MEFFSLCCSSGPVRCIRHCEIGHALNEGWDKHCLVTWQDGLANRDLTASLVLAANSSSTIITVGLLREWLFDLAILVTVKASILPRLLAPSILSKPSLLEYLTIDCGYEYVFALGSHWAIN